MSDSADRTETYEQTLARLALPGLESLRIIEESRRLLARSALAQASTAAFDHRAFAYVRQRVAASRQSAVPDRLDHGPNQPAR